MHLVASARREFNCGKDLRSDLTFAVTMTPVPADGADGAGFRYFGLRPCPADGAGFRYFGYGRM